jgi:hypothetical protein
MLTATDGRVKPTGAATPRRLPPAAPPSQRPAASCPGTITAPWELKWETETACSWPGAEPWELGCEGRCVPEMVMSWMLLRLFFALLLAAASLALACRKKYFCAWLATCPSPHVSRRLAHRGRERARGDLGRGACVD